MAKRISELDALTGSLANTDLFVMVDSASTADAESKKVEYQTIRDAVKASVTNTALTAIAYTSSNTTFNFNRSDSGTVTLQFNPSINACSDVDINAIGSGQIIKWNGSEFTPIDLEVSNLSDANASGVADKDLLLYNSASSEFIPKSHSEYLDDALMSQIGNFVEPTGLVHGDFVRYNTHVYTITDATQTSPVRLTTTGSGTLPSGEAITVTGVVGMTELNTNSYFAKRINATTYDLYSDSALSVAVDGTGFTAYSSAGVMGSNTYRSYEPSSGGNVLQVQSHILPANITFGIANSFSDNPDTHRFDFTPQSTDSTIIYRLTGWIGTGTSSGTNITGTTSRAMSFVLFDYAASQIINANDYLSGGSLATLPHASQANWLTDSGGAHGSIEFIWENSSTTTMKPGVKLSTGGTNSETFCVWGNHAETQAEFNKNAGLMTVTITEVQN
jgi:hypothetical protein